MAKILLAEDEVNIASFIERGLKEFGHSVTVCHDGNTGWRILQEEPFDLVVLDIIMPKINGLELCHLYRQMFGYQAPVIMLTALGTTEDIVKGLDAGADDYLVKPFSFQELEARIKALLRRNKETVTNQLTCDNLVLDCNTRRAKRGDADIDLTVKEYRLLEYFMTHQGVALSRITLLKDVWDKNFDTNTNIVDVYVNYLRVKIDRDFDTVQVLISFTFPCGAVLCVKLYVYESFCIQFVEPGKELTVCIADTAVNNLFILDCNTKFVHRKSEVTGHSLDMFVVRVGRERDFIGSVTVAVCILLFEGFQDCLKLVCGGRHAHANIFQPFRIDVWAVSNGCIGAYVRNRVDVSVRCCHFFSYTWQIQDSRNVRAVFLKIIFQRNEYALVYTIGEDCIIA